MGLQRDRRRGKPRPFALRAAPLRALQGRRTALRDYVGYEGRLPLLRLTTRSDGRINPGRGLIRGVVWQGPTDSRRGRGRTAETFVRTHSRLQTRDFHRISGNLRLLWR